MGELRLRHQGLVDSLFSHENWLKRSAPLRCQSFGAWATSFSEGLSLSSLILGGLGPMVGGREMSRMCCAW